MSVFFHRAIHPRAHPSAKDKGGFNDGKVYKIVNQEDKSVLQVEWEEKDGKHICTIVTDVDADTDAQRFRATQVDKQSKHEKHFQIQSVVQKEAQHDHIWDYVPHVKLLLQHASHKVWNRMWYTKKKEAGSRIYFIKPTTDDICLTNMGNGKQIALLPVSSEHGARQHWSLEPVDETE